MSGAEVQGYVPREVPGVPGEVRWGMLDRLPNGFGASGPGEVIATCAGVLAAERIADSRTYEPALVEVKLRAVVVLSNDAYALVRRGSVAGLPAFVPRRPSKLWKKLKGPDLFDSFVLGEQAYTDAPDQEVWAALLEVAQRYRISGRDLRLLNDNVAILVALRAGLRVGPDVLPNIDPAMVVTVAEAEADA